MGFYQMPEKSEVGSCWLTDGRPLITVDCSQSYLNQKINITHLAAGEYFVYVLYDGMDERLKFIKK